MNEKVILRVPSTEVFINTHQNSIYFRLKYTDIIFYNQTELYPWSVPYIRARVPVSVKPRGIYNEFFVI